MKKKHFKPEQIATVLKQVEFGMPIAEVLRRTGISEQTFYRWKKVYDGLEANQVRELKQLQDENARLSALSRRAVDAAKQASQAAQNGGAAV